MFVQKIHSAAALFSRHAANKQVRVIWYAPSERKSTVDYILLSATVVAPFLVAHWCLDHYYWTPMRQECEEQVAKYRAKQKAYMENRRMEEEALTNEIDQLKRKRVALVQEIENLRNGGKNGR